MPRQHQPAATEYQRCPGARFDNRETKNLGGKRWFSIWVPYYITSYTPVKTNIILEHHNFQLEIHLQMVDVPFSGLFFWGVNPKL